MPGEPKTVVVRQFPIELSQFLKFAGLFGSGGEAKQAVLSGRVRLNGTIELQRGRKLKAGDRVEIDGEVLVVAAS